MQLNVSILSDDNYAKHLGTAIVSLLENNASLFESVRIFILDNGISKVNKIKLERIAYDYNNASLEFCDISKLGDVVKPVIDNGWCVSTYGWFLLSSVIGESIDKVLHLDSDLVINQGIKELYETNVDNYYVAGIIDVITKEYKANIGMQEDSNYINSGVMLVNLKKWREDKIEEKLFKCVNSIETRLFNADQDILNIVLERKTLVVPIRYNLISIFAVYNYDSFVTGRKIRNYYGKKEVLDASKHPTIIHFTGKSKPWMKNCKHPLKGEYEKYRRKTPWPMELEDEYLLSRGEKIKHILFKYMPHHIIQLLYSFKISKKERRHNYEI